ncbi:Regulatory sensor-transducer, BlaR1/MecR1 family [Indibacter alkaliphilus LW1]|uniref:Regulatory sensor-transducer, BlaR1/MecR1 family n=1 Tax=Indibacter alkaliphilus (strain CCUG 57479 / KCTC 22604 / LW1) TaxID=1189612 RepID=S2DRE7_INDAL|nr:Regulatory sensor-transducer, BlaR1/MecR1 family [Indibacter alkaliphilus LW1]
MFYFNRYYLLASVLLSFFIPLITIEVTVDEAPLLVPNQEINFPQTNHNPPNLVSTAETVGLDWVKIALAVPFVISLFFFFRFVQNIALILKKVKSSEVVKFKSHTLVLLEEKSMPYSFLRYVFLSKSSYENGEVSRSILNHEITHVREWHSIDNIFIEFLLVFFWFNPMLYWAKHEIKLNHEFIADQSVLKKTPVNKYKRLLISMTLPDFSRNLTSSLKFSFTEKRLNMMDKQTTLSVKILKGLVTIPFLVGAILLFSEKVPAQEEIQKSRTLSYEVDTEKTEENSYDLDFSLQPDGTIILGGKEIDETFFKEEFLGKIKRNKEPKALLQVLPGTTMGLVSDLQNKLFSIGISHIDLVRLPKEQKENDPEKAEFYKNVTFQIIKDNGSRVNKTYQDLSEKQKSELPDPMKAPEKKSPTLESFEKWKSPENYAIWIDGVSVKNEKLEQFENSDFAFFSESFVHLNARSERFPQKYQVHAYTHSGYEASYGKDSDFLRKRNWTITIKE